MRTCNFFVHGVPQPQGSMRSFRVKSGANVTLHSNKNLMPWRNEVAAVAHVNWDANPSMRPFEVSLVFAFQRPKSHYGTGKNYDALKDWAESMAHIKTPDGDKLMRAILDALTGVIWHDDSQVYRWNGLKMYGDNPGVNVSVKEME